MRESLAQPLELIVEDLQWLDRETEAFSAFSARAWPAPARCWLVNFRPEYRRALEPQELLHQLRLGPLGEAEARELLRALLGDAAGIARSST
ncbi:hypothetical protein ACU4GD_10445 [Cupriavidus basilensis]